MWAIDNFGECVKLMCVCVCVRERERERERDHGQAVLSTGHVCAEGPGLGWGSRDLDSSLS